MNYSKRKNGFKITVKKWSNEVVITEIVTNEIKAIKTFPDHIQAVLVAKKL